MGLIPSTRGTHGRGRRSPSLFLTLRLLPSLSSCLLTGGQSGCRGSIQGTGGHRRGKAGRRGGWRHLETGQADSHLWSVGGLTVFLLNTKSSQMRVIACIFQQPVRTVWSSILRTLHIHKSIQPSPPLWELCLLRDATVEVPSIRITVT